MVNVSRDGKGKTRVAKGDKSGLGGQYAPDPQKLAAAKNKIETLSTIIDETPVNPSIINYKNHYPTPTFREFNSVEITVDGEYMYSDDLVDSETVDGFNTMLATELEASWLEYDKFEAEILHVPEHVAPAWVYQNFPLNPKFLMSNNSLDKEEQQIFNNIIDTVAPINVASQDLSTLKIREADGVTQIQWKTSVPFLNDETLGRDLLDKINEYNQKFQNITLNKQPDSVTVNFSGWYTLSLDEKTVIQKVV